MNSILLAVMMIGLVGFLAYLAYDTWLDIKKVSKSRVVGDDKPQRYFNTRVPKKPHSVSSKAVCCALINRGMLGCLKRLLSGPRPVSFRRWLPARFWQPEIGVSRMFLVGASRRAPTGLPILL